MDRMTHLGICEKCLKNIEPTRLNDWVSMVTNNAQMDHVYSGWYFDPIFQNVIHSFKYLDRPKFAFHFGRYLAKEIGSTSFPIPDQLIPVPLHHVKKRTRKYNQADWLALGLSKEMGIPVNRKACKKLRYTTSQTTLSVQERMQNVAAGFRCTQDLSGKHIGIVDDVLTTGSTVSAVAQACKIAGAETITAITLCTPKKEGSE